MARNVELRRSGGSGYTEKLNVKTSWDIIENKPTNFTPDAHSHDIEEINTLTTELNDRYTKTEVVNELAKKQNRRKSVNGLNMDSVTDTGFYYGYTMENAAVKTISTFIVIKYSQDWITQLQFRPHATGPAYIRSKHSGTTWSSWKKLAYVPEVDAVASALNSFKALKGANNGLAELDDSGNVPASQLPSYVDDVLIYDNYAELPQPGETGKIYVTRNDNITYRWGGSDYVEISKSLALGTTTSTAYPGNKGKANRDDINTILNTYATQNWVEGKNYVNTTFMNSTLLNYAKMDDIPSLAGYATQNWVEGKNYAKVADIPTVPTDLSAFNNDVPFLTFQDVQGNYVPISRTINGQPLSTDINLTASDVGATNTYITSGNYSEVPPGKRWVPTSYVSSPTYSVSTTSSEPDFDVLPSPSGLPAGTTGYVYTQSLPMEEAYYIVQEVGEGEGLITLRRNDNGQVSFTIPKPGEGGATENNYVTGISGSGNGVLTLTRQGLPDLTQSLSHSHGSFTQSNDIPNNQVLDKITVTRGIVSSYSLRTMTPAHIGAAPSNHTHNYVPTSRTINGKPLSSNISLTAANVSAVPTTRTINGKPLSSNISLTAANVSAVPTTRTINGKELSTDISLTAANVSAVPTTRTIAGRALSSNITTSQLKTALSVPTTLDDLISASEGQIAVRGDVGWVATDTAPNTTRWGGYRIRVGSGIGGSSGSITFSW